MSTIPPSLSQVLLGRPAATSSSATLAKTADSTTRFSDTLSAQKAFFRQVAGQTDRVNQPAPKPAGTVSATFRAADIAQATASGANAEDVRLLRPGSLLNIRV